MGKGSGPMALRARLLVRCSVMSQLIPTGLDMVSTVCDTGLSAVEWALRQAVSRDCRSTAAN